MPRTYSLYLFLVCCVGCTTTTPIAAYQPAAQPPSLVTNNPSSPVNRAAFQAAKISQRSREQLQVLYDDPEGVARQCQLCTDGLRIYVHTPFMLQLPYEYQVAVLAHEFAHGDLGHVTAGVALGQGLDALARSTKSAEEWSTGAAVAYSVGKTLVSNAAARQFEHQADLYAAARLQYAGLAPETMADALIYTMQILGEGGGGWLSTHPADAARIESIRAEALRLRSQP